ncbi:hypothetical protein C7G43_20820 [Bradyrhizobium sp. MOS004]|nr:hypothetical protein C7G43_20820 [Bradyrhizobium sp. MOS004]
MFLGTCSTARDRDACASLQRSLFSKSSDVCWSPRQPARGRADGNPRSNALKRDEIGSNRHRALALCLSMIFSENRFALFRIML